jgi:hypothetical protein
VPFLTTCYVRLSQAYKGRILRRIIRKYFPPLVRQSAISANWKTNVTNGFYLSFSTPKAVGQPMWYSQLSLVLSSKVVPTATLQMLKGSRYSWNYCCQP